MEGFLKVYAVMCLFTLWYCLLQIERPKNTGGWIGLALCSLLWPGLLFLAFVEILWSATDDQ